MAIYGDLIPLPYVLLTCEESMLVSDQVLEDTSTLWLHNNIIKMSQEFGVAFKGGEKEAFAFVYESGSNKRVEKEITLVVDAHIKKQLFSKEFKDLEFHMKFKEGEPQSEIRNRGRNTKVGT